MTPSPHGKSRQACLGSQDDKFKEALPRHGEFERYLSVLTALVPSDQGGLGGLDGIHPSLSAKIDTGVDVHKHGKGELTATFFRQFIQHLVNGLSQFGSVAHGDHGLFIKTSWVTHMDNE
jgi:hypothetical protein